MAAMEERNAWTGTRILSVIIRWLRQVWRHSTSFLQNDEPHPWIMIEYPEPMNITKVVIKNRKSCCGDRFRDIEVRVSKEKPELSINQSFTGL